MRPYPTASRFSSALKKSAAETRRQQRFRARRQRLDGVEVGFEP